MLCDITKIHTGYIFSPRVTHTMEDEEWGRVGSTKKVYTAKSLIHGGGFFSNDKVLERIENVYWKIQVDGFQSLTLGFYKFVGEWRTIPLGKKKVQIEYIYSLYSDKPFCYLFNWIFAKVFWKRYMRRVMKNIKSMISAREPYQYG